MVHVPLPDVLCTILSASSDRHLFNAAAIHILLLGSVHVAAQSLGVEFARVGVCGLPREGSAYGIVPPLSH